MRVPNAPAVLIAALAMLVTACGSDDTPTTPRAGGAGSSAPAVITPTATVPGAPSGGLGGTSADQDRSLEKLRKVAQCMRARGYTVEDPKNGGLGVAPKKVTDVDKANKDAAECAKQANGG
ncbi:hypothetical protein GCM10010411_75770 [Actinomadura fulvescens]|uniref:Uncharacterized protein n=1 Tax=Actinomadura fulvescens TaxID=46160 RepID=A0ABN3QIN2_9ACTN